MDARAGLTSLPPELLTLVVGWLPPLNALRLRGLCHLLCRVVEQRSSCPRAARDASTEAELHLLWAHLPLEWQRSRLTRLSQTRLSWSALCRPSPPRVAPLLAALPLLEHLALAGFTAESVFPFHSAETQFARLQSLSVTASCFANASLAHCPRLFELRSLASLTLRSCNLSGCIPDSLGNLVSLVFLDLSFNKLSGPITFSIGKLHLLEHLDMQGNLLDGGLPSQMSLCTRLQVLNLSRNRFYGTVPDDLFADMQGLQFVSLWCNRLHGSLPASLWTRTHLEYANFGSNFFQVGGGSIPRNAVGLPHLRFLNLAQNPSGAPEVHDVSRRSPLPRLNAHIHEQPMQGNGSLRIYLDELVTEGKQGRGGHNVGDGGTLFSWIPHFLSSFG